MQSQLHISLDLHSYGVHKVRGRDRFRGITKHIAQ